MYGLFLIIKIRIVLVSDAGPNLTLIFSEIWSTEVLIVEEAESAIHLLNLQQSHVPIDRHII